MSLLLISLWADQSPILIESQESKTATGGPIFNKISYKKEKGKDIWLMEQSHYGVKAPQIKWDKIAITVEGLRGKRRAQFMQLENSYKVIALHQKRTNFKVSCFFCHSNGPRAIRPNYDSSFAKISLWNKARIQLWNLKIKSYGPMKSEGVGSAKAFRHSGPIANEILKVKACTKCHQKSGFFARGELTKQNFLAIRHMIENQIMPPPGFSLSPKELIEIKEFIQF